MYKRYVRCPICQKQHEISELPEDALSEDIICDCGRVLRNPASRAGAKHVEEGAERTYKGPWRDGKYLVVTHMSEFPCRCMRCNEEIPKIKQVELRFQNKNDPSGIEALHLFWAPLALLSLHRLATATDRVIIRYGHCDEHRPWVSARTLSTLFGLAAIAMLAMGVATLFQYGNPYPRIIYWFLGSIAPFTLAIIAAVWPWEARVKKKGHLHAWITGFGKAYLEQLPEYHHDGEAVMDEL